MKLLAAVTTMLALFAAVPPQPADSNPKWATDAGSTARISERECFRGTYEPDSGVLWFRADVGPVECPPLNDGSGDLYKDFYGP